MVSVVKMPNALTNLQPKDKPLPGLQINCKEDSRPNRTGCRGRHKQAEYCSAVAFAGPRDTIRLASIRPIIKGNPMLDQLTIDSFRPLLGTAFTVRLAEEKSLDLVLDQVNSLTEKMRIPDARREPFALIFNGPPEVLLHQQIVSLTHQAFDTLSIFLVPIGRRQDGRFEYEATFT